MAIRRPTPAHLGKRKRVDSNPDQVMLMQAAATAVFGASPYHCRGAKGQPLVTRAKPASPCPRQWSDEEATRTLRAAISRGKISDTWEDGFPKLVWHKDGNVFYEARHTRGPGGSFHAYPVEDIELPRDLRL
jgi:hypothetical protein